MQTYQGKSVFQGVAIGKIFVYQKSEQQVTRKKIEDVAAEKTRFLAAKDQAKAELAGLYEDAVKRIGEEGAMIFMMHQLLLDDIDYVGAIENMIETQEVNAEFAVATTAENLFNMFNAMEDDYMRGRAADMKDISERVLNVLSGVGNGAANLTEPVIIVADDLAPSETVQLDKDKVLAFVTVKGSANSHTAILARTMGIPALIQTQLTLDAALNGKDAVVDGMHGVFYVEPDEETAENMAELKRVEDEQKALLATLKDKETVTLDGQKVHLYANIGDIKDLALVMKNDAEGIGLFRSEFIYLEHSDFPTEEEQFRIYKTVAETMGNKKVIIRTLDIGADKQCDYFHMEHEENPAMGCRAIRICLTRPEIFRTQLRALFRASAYGNLAIMFPMIISVREVHEIKEIVAQIKAELEQEGIQYGDPELGIMIETPAAVFMADELAKEVDFFSIGTNDLTQYMLAIDRQNEQLDRFYDAHHPAVLRAIESTVQHAHAAGIWCGICGELGADTELTRTFLRMGVDELSVSPAKVLPIRKIIRESDVSSL